MASDEQVGLLTCTSGHHSLLLDSRDYWSDVLQSGRPKQVKCRCRESLFRVSLAYEFRDDGNVACVDVLLNCSACQRDKVGANFEINYYPTDGLLERPLDPIDNPWLKARQCQITSYWKAEDCERFASYMARNLGARIYRGADPVDECTIDCIEFYPELACDLYFTNIADAVLEPVRDPYKKGPFLYLGSPIHMGLRWPESVLLHYIEYAEEILDGTEIIKQPESFLSFARQARDWLMQNYISKRGRNTADSPSEYQRSIAR